MELNKPKVRCLICQKECNGDCEDANLHKLRTGHNRWQLLIEEDTCAECGVELSHPEHKFCSLCVSSKEHIADLGWELIRENTENERGNEKV